MNCAELHIDKSQNQNSFDDENVKYCDCQCKIEFYELLIRQIKNFYFPYFR